MQVEAVEMTNRIFLDCSCSRLSRIAIDFLSWSVHRPPSQAIEHPA
jgi:hypothetical protein